MNNELIGVWNSDQSDEATKENTGNVKMTFTEDGKLIYDINTGSKVQRMNLVYKIDGDNIISDQPSHPQKQSSKFKVEDSNRLIIEFEGEKAVFIRASKKAKNLFNKIFGGK
jgi:hypothetical protein